MKALVDFITAYEPLYPQVIQRVAAEKIKELEARAGRPLPGAYRDFLESIGDNVGFPTPNVELDPDAVLEIASLEDRPPPDRFIPFAEDLGPTSHHYYLDLAQPRGDDDALVVRVSTGEQPIPSYWSFRDMMFSWAFKEVRMLRLPHVRQLAWLLADEADPTIALSALETIMTRLGFSALAVTSPEARLYERGDAAASVYRVPFAPSFSLLVAARERVTALRIVETIRDAMPASAELVGEAT